MDRRIGMIDLETGELLNDGIPIWVSTKTKSPFGRRWVGMNQDFLAELAARKDIGLTDMRVFVYLNSRLDFDNIIQVPQIEVAEKLGIRKQHVSRSIRKLEELGIIIRGPKAGRSSAWRLNPNAGWKGKVRNLKPALDRHLRIVT